MSSVTSSRSAVWKYYKKENSQEAQCLICKKLIHNKGNTSNLHSHLKYRHPNTFMEMKSYSNQNELREETDDFEATGDLSEEDPAIIEPAIEIEEGDASSVNFSPSGTSSTPSSQQSKNIMPFFFPNSRRTSKLDKCLAYFISVDMQPYSVVEQEGFKHLIRTMQPGYQLPSRKTLAEVLIPRLYSETKAYIKNIIDSVEYLSFTTDAWTSAASKPYISLTAHFIVDWTLKSAVLNCREVSEDHTAENLAAVLFDLLNEWEIPKNKIVSFTTDCGSNIVKAIEIMSFSRINCFGHALNTAVNAAFNLEDMQGEIEKIKKIQNIFAHSWQIDRELRDLQTKYSLPRRKIPSFTKTRWWSLLHLIEVIIEQNTALTSLLQTYNKGKYRNLCLSITEIDMLTALKDTLKPLEVMTEILAAEKFITASAIFPLYLEITSNSSNIVDIEETQVDQTIIGTKIHITQTVVDYLEKRYLKTPNQKLIKKCTFFDPRFKMSSSALDPDSVNKIKPEIIEEMENLKIQPLDQQSKKKKTSGLSSLFSSTKCATPDTSCLGEFKKYSESPRIDAEEDPLQWWKSNESGFPRLSHMAKKYLSVCATSVPSERVFSKGGQVVTDNRTNLTADHSEQLIFLSCNKEYVKK